ncbi:MAG: cytochrome c, partial [Candidatus Tectomicrobia bacterium]|nr:cytochrome c [Candidatus Tectomicrobia bacterium]
MKHKQVSAIAAILCCLVLSLPLSALAQEEGEQLFKQVCAACHTINGGKLVGPDLANVHKRRPQEWLLSFIKASQSVINSGDEYAVKLFEEFNKIPMPDNNYSDAQILSIIDYIVLNSPGDESAG